ncbi:hypothetical protein [Sphingomonas oryzagri]
MAWGRFGDPGWIGTDEGAPGERGPGAYFAYFRDLDGNKLCGFKWG